MFSGASQNFWINLIGFQLIWWICVLFGNTWLVIVWLLVALHLFFHREPVTELFSILICATIGFVIDTLLTLNGIFMFQNHSEFPSAWLFALWISFSATLRQSLKFFTKHYTLAAILGALGGSGAYLTAEQFGQFDFGLPLWNTGLLLAFIWSVLFPLLIWVSHQFPRSGYAKAI